MAAMTDFLEDNLLNHVLRNIAYTSPAGVFVALFTAAPGEGGGGTEVAGGSYARQTPGFGAPAANQVANAADITFPVATAGWGTVTHCAVFDAVSGGNMLFYGTLAQAKVVDIGDTFKFLAGNLTVGLD